MISLVDVEIIRNLLVSASEEMAITIVRTSRSTTVRDLLDFSTAVFDASGRNVAQAARMPVHLNSMEPCLRHILAHHVDIRSLRPGDVIGTNDPYSGGQHLPDLLTFRPAFDGTELIGFAGVLCHHVDIGGGAAGGYNAKATEIFQEGVRIPAARLASRTTPEPLFEKFIRLNVREPDEYMGDFVAQLSALDVAVRKIEEIAKKYGTARFTTALGRICEQSRTEAAKIIEKLPDGSGRFVQWVDDDGITDDAASVVAEVRKLGGEVTVDLSQSSPQSAGPINATLASTYSAAYFALGSVLTPQVPINAGAFTSFRILSRPGTIPDCRPPAPVVSRMLVCHKVILAIWGALAELYPDLVPAAYYGSSYPYSHAFPIEGGMRVYFDAAVGGWGATARNSGVSALSAGFHNSANTPIEIIEALYPVRFVSYGIRRGSGGAGRNRGGDGIRRSWIVQRDGTFNANMDGFKSGPFGLNGGAAGAPAALTLQRGGEMLRLPSKIANLPVRAGDQITLETAGGGGWGEVER